MAVVVNEFEVVPEADRPAAAAPAPAAAAAAAKSPLAPAELDRALRTLRERCARLRAD
jgi:hypothetical protein